MKIVGLKIEKGRIAAAVVQKALRQTTLVDSFVRSFATDAELVEILKEKAKDWAGARIVSSLPGAFFSQRTILFPFADRKRLEKALPFEIEDMVPFPLDEVMVDQVVLDAGKAGKDAAGLKEYPVLGMVLPKTILRQHLALLASAGIDPQVVVPSYAGLLALVKMMRSDASVLYCCGSDLCITSGGGMKAIRSFAPAGAGAGLGHTLKALEVEHRLSVEKAVLLCGDDQAQAALADLGIVAESLAPEFSGAKPADAVSLGLALFEGANFRRGEFAYRIADAGTRRRKRALLVAGAAAAFFAVLNMGVRFYLVESGYGRIDRELRDIYAKTFPGTKLQGDPLERMQEKVNEARKKLGVLGTGSSVLEVMKAVTEGVPREVRVSFTEFNFEGDRLRLQGETGSFESVDKVKAELQKNGLFGDVAVLDTRMGVDNKVKFRMDIKLKEML